MKYGKEYAKKVFELIPEANFVAVNLQDESCWYGSESKPLMDKYGTGWNSDEYYLGKVECDDWKESLIGREDVGL